MNSALQIRAARAAYRGFLAAVHMAIPDREARPIAVYLLVTLCNVPGSVAGRAAGITKQAVSKALRQIEDRREDPDFDRALQALEDQIAEAA